MRGSNCKALPGKVLFFLYRWLLKGGGRLLTLRISHVGVQ